MFQDKINAILAKGSGTKVALFDTYTKKIISSLISQNTFFENNFFLFHLLSDTRVKISTLTAVIFIRPESIYELIKELKDPFYGQYIIYFTSKIDNDILEILAKSDIFNLIDTILEMNIDVIKIDNKLYQIANNNSEFGENSLSGLFSIFCTYGISPDIILHDSWFSETEKNNLISYKNNFMTKILFNKDSDTKILFNKNSLSNKKESGLIQKINSYTEKFLNKGTILFLDRKFDTITPMMYEWRYQSMIQEYCKFKYPGIIKFDKLYSLDDKFYQKNKFLEIDNVSKNLKNFMNNQNKELNFDNMKNKESLEKHLKIHNFIINECLPNKEICELEMKILKNNINFKKFKKEIENLKNQENFKNNENKIIKLILIYLQKNPKELKNIFFQKYLKYFKKSQNLPIFKEKIDLKLAYIPPIYQILNSIFKKKYKKFNLHFFKNSNNFKDKNIFGTFVIYLNEITFSEYRIINLFFEERKIDDFVIVCEKIVNCSEILENLK